MAIYTPKKAGAVYLRGKKLESIYKGRECIYRAEDVWEDDDSQGEMVFTVKVRSWETVDLSNFIWAPVGTAWNEPVEVIINWGDGTPEETYNVYEPVSGYNLNPSIVHSYTTAEYSGVGVYDITIKGLISLGEYFEYPRGKTSLATQCLYITLPEGKKSPIVGVGLTAFSDWSLLESVPSGLLLRVKELYGGGGSVGMFSGCIKLSTIPKDLFFRFAQCKGFNGCFSNCVSLVDIPEGLFSKCVNATRFTRCFAKCSNLVDIPEGLFYKCVKAAEFDYCFSECTKLTRIPEMLFSKCVNVTSAAGCFSDCSLLADIPELLFAQVDDNAVFDYCFKNCTALQAIPDTLFATKGRMFRECFSGCSAVTGHLPELWNRLAKDAGSRCFNNCDKADNYEDAYYEGWADDPALAQKMVLVVDTTSYARVDLSNWMFAVEGYSGTVLIDWGDGSVPESYELPTQFRRGSVVGGVIYHNYSDVSNKQRISITGEFGFGAGVYAQPRVGYLEEQLIGIEILTVQSPIVDVEPQGLSHCRHLQEVPEGLFDRCVNTTSFSGFFEGCSSLKTVPAGLFSNCTAVTDFSSCFQGTGLVSIPQGLFKNRKLAENFSHCFKGCSSLTSVPANLFSNRSKAVTFAYCFANCTSLETVYASVFESTSAETFEGCFMNCTSLKSLADSLFNYCRRAVNFSKCFEGCAQLTSATSYIFKYAEQAVDMSFCFSNCTSLKFISAELFVVCKNLTNVSNCFYSCSSLPYIPADLFASNLSVSDFTACFAKCSGVEGLLPRLWETHGIASHNTCFDGCELALNYIDAYNKGWAITPIPAWPELILVCNIPSSGFVLDLKPWMVLTNNISSPTAAMVDWGDYSEPDAPLINSPIQHVYMAAGEYRVTIRGDIGWGLNKSLVNLVGTYKNESLCQVLTSVEVPDGKPCAINYIRPYTFHCCVELKTISARIFERCRETTDFSNCFYYCYKLEFIPIGLFDSGVNATSFASAFRDCTSLKEIPGDLFRYCTKVKDFSWCFGGCSFVTKISKFTGESSEYSGYELLFAFCKEATTFANCFRECSRLTGVYYTFFKDLPVAANFEGCFDGCSSIDVMPGFEGCPNITNLNKCFRSCSALQTLRVLWNIYPSASHNSCFYMCTAASNYAAAQAAGWA